MEPYRGNFYMENKKILVTSALPYANGSIHLGHLLEAVQTDIFVRFQKSIGNECYYFCADDTHGTPVMLAAKKEGISPEELVARIREEHYRDLVSFYIQYDNYYSTNTPENKFFSEDIYLKLKEKNHISEREIEQSYCNHDAMFLPDRFIKGTCPKCGAKDQYGDGCEICGTTYSPKDLIHSQCAICGSTPVLKNSKHYFFKLQDFEKKLLEWMDEKNHSIDSGVKRKLSEWFKDGLKEWDISRDGPYFGFKIPGEENKYFYVWLDAPIGYIASSKNYFQEHSIETFEEFWKQEKGEIVHFIGKDILYFHALFWPAMLMGAGYSTPNRVNVHGFLTVNGEKMSKSRGTFIKAETYLRHLDPEHFRFYMAAKLNDSMEDIDLNFNDFSLKVNSDLIGNFVNIFSRVSTSILDKLDRKLGKVSQEGNLLIQECLSSKNDIEKYYSTRNYSKAMKEIMRLCDNVNKYVNDKAPWSLIKTDPEKAREVVTDTLNAGKILAVLLTPVLPMITERIFRILDIPNPTFLKIEELLENKEIGLYEFLSNRVDEKAIEKMIEEGKMSEPEKKPEVTETGYIKIEDLSKVELRVGLITEASEVEGADKLVNVKVDLGEKGVKNVFAGIKTSYKPEELKGLKVVVVANLEPRKMKFGISEAMLLASGKDSTLSLFVPHRNANPGDLLK
jgi:methionyl-tRNA synthetase